MCSSVQHINSLGTIAGKEEYRTDLITRIQIPLPTLQFPSAETQTDRAMAVVMNDLEMEKSIF
jgi:hypothetical protein